MNGRQRVRLVVEAELDEVPGWGHQPEDWQVFLQRALEQLVGHYNPVVTIEGGE